MKKELPPLKALVAFEAVARLSSFSKAAAEMRITQGAVSKQIKILEEYFGKILFERFGNNLKITKIAQEYYGNVNLIFESIKSATEKIRNDNENSLEIHGFASFNVYWLLSRIKDFEQQNPDIKIRIGNGFGTEVDIDKMDYDVIIWGYKHSFKNAEYEKLIDENMLLVCSPALIDKPLHKISDLLQYPFIKNNYRPKLLYKLAALYELDPKSLTINLSFDYLYMTIEAAKQGLGMTLVPEICAKDLIKEGVLINPLDIKLKTNMKFYAVYPNKNVYKKNVIKFSKWLREQLKKDLQ